MPKIWRNAAEMGRVGKTVIWRRMGQTAPSARPRPLDVAVFRIVSRNRWLSSIACYPACRKKRCVQACTSYIISKGDAASRCCCTGYSPRRRTPAPHRRLGHDRNRQVIASVTESAAPAAPVQRQFLYLWDSGSTIPTVLSGKGQTCNCFTLVDACLDDLCNQVRRWRQRQDPWQLSEEAVVGHQAHGYENEYSEKSFWDKAASCARIAAGKEVIEKALWLYYAGQARAVPPAVKSVVFGALGYFIFPIDAIPDLTPVVGYADDLGVLVAAVTTVSMRITPAVKKKASEKLTEWFGD